MREIKFRVRDRQLNKWIDLEQYQSMGAIEVENDGTLTLSPRFRFTQSMMICPEAFEVMQYTGLKDKNGKEIYEGDIVKFRFKKDRPECSDLIGFIEYQEQYCSFKIVSSPENGAFRIDYETIIEVIGNIYDNPDLLKE